MKVLIVLALALAVANAAFTGSLVQQTKPLLNKAKMNMHMAVARNVRARSSAEAGFQTSLIEGLSNQATAIMEQIQNAISNGVEVANHLTQQLSSVMAELQELGGNAVDGVSSIVGGFIDQISNLWNNLWGSKSRSNIVITPEMSGIIQMILGNPTFVNLFRSEPMYQCLKSKGITVDYAHLQALNNANELGPQLLNRPEMAACIEEVGGLHTIISTSATIRFLQQLAQQLNLVPLLHSVMTQLLGAEMTQQIIALLSPRLRGFFDGLSNLWGVISEGASNAWDAITGQASSFVDYIAQVVENVYDSAAAQFTAIQNMATMMVSQGLGAAQQLGLQGAQALIDWIAPYHNDLGNLYDQVISQLTAIYDGLVLPTFVTGN